VLDIGCGNGERCLDIASRGAKRVIGIDPHEDSVRVAVASLDKYPAAAGVVEFLHCTVHDLTEQDFDAVISEDTFEHVLDVPEVLAAIRRVLRPGGRAYIGFGPLYHSPRGDHGWMQRALPGGKRFLIPWGHLLVPQRVLFRRMEKLYGKPVRSTTDWPFLALNQKTAADFRRMFRDSGLRTVQGRSNANFSWKGRLFGAVGKLPFIGRYFTLGLYYILEK